MSFTLETPKKCLVTGGAGFIGSHLVERLLSMGSVVTMYDKSSNSSVSWLKSVRRKSDLRIVEADLRDRETLDSVMADNEVVFHLAAYNSKGKTNTLEDSDLQNNFASTLNLLESMQRHGVRELVFASSQQVYGDLSSFPLSETSGPLLPISLYGASKLACEGTISAYCHLYDMQATIFRFSNIVGGRMTHGIVYDFMQKLIDSPERLEILGDGRQARSYLLIDHCLDAVLLACSTRATEPCRVYNLGNLDTVTATEVGQIVIQEMHLDRITELWYVGGSRGWRGDIPNLYYDLQRIQDLGWTPKLSSASVVRECARRLLREVAEQYVPKISNTIPIDQLFIDSSSHRQNSVE